MHLPLRYRGIRACSSSHPRSFFHIALRRLACTRTHRLQHHHVPDMTTSHSPEHNQPPALPTDAQEAAPAAAVEEAVPAAEPAAAKEAVEEVPLPDGWVQDVTDEGRVYYIDHVNKATSCRELRPGHL